MRVAELKPIEGLRVVDGLVVKEYCQGAWQVLGVALSVDVREYPTVTD